jgi:hypothetical protein
MSQEPRANFTALDEAERKSRLWHLASQKGQCTLWVRGEISRQNFRVKDFDRESGKLSFHSEDQNWRSGQDVLGTFELKGMSFFFKGRVQSANAESFVLTMTGEFYKSERRRATRMLAYPLYEIKARFNLPASYDEGKVRDIRHKASNTGLFKSFLRLVDEEKGQNTGSELILRVQDLSASGMSVHIGPVEAEWFRTGELISDVNIALNSQDLIVPKVRVVYVVDHIGGDRRTKLFKVGLRFEELPRPIEEMITKNIQSLLKLSDVNNDFEDFVK